MSYVKQMQDIAGMTNEEAMLVSEEVAQDFVLEYNAWLDEQADMNDAMNSLEGETNALYFR